MTENNFKLLNFFRSFFYAYFYKKMTLKKFLTSVFIVFYLSVFSQKTIENQRVWFAYTGQFKVSKKWGYHLEAQFRLNNQLQQSFQNLYRIGGIYYLSTSKNISGGYALVNTYNLSLEDFFKENRLWEQYQYTKKWHENKNIIIHRLRLEQRWVESIGLVDDNVLSFGSNYQNRFRYLNRNLFHLGNLNAGNEEIYMLLQNEVFLNLGKNKINENLIDQNRFLIGLGMNYYNNTRLEIGYLNHFISSSTSNDVINHTVSISLIQNLVL